MKAIIEKVEKAIQSVINGSASQYINFEHNDEDWTIRVANHNANPMRMDDNSISFVIDMIEEESEEVSNFSVNKKRFKSIPNQFHLNEDGDFTEQFCDIEECLEYILN